MSESQMSDSKFAKRFFTMIGLLILLTVVLVILAHLNSGEVSEKIRSEKQAQVDAIVAERVEPVGTLNVGEQPEQMVATEPAPSDTTGGESGGGDPAASESAAVPAGDQVYQQSCAMCHTTGVAGAPKIGDAGAWSDRIAQGVDMLYDHAINGFQGSAGVMPAKGGNTALSDDAVRAAVDHMIEASR